MPRFNNRLRPVATKRKEQDERKPRPTNEAARGSFRVADDRTIGGMGKIGRSDVADFMLDQLESDAWLRRKPVIVY